MSLLRVPCATSPGPPVPSGVVRVPPAPFFGSWWSISSLRGHPDGMLVRRLGACVAVGASRSGPEGHETAVPLPPGGLKAGIHSAAAEPSDPPWGGEWGGRAPLTCPAFTF